ncbi:MAG: hypothetical protein U0175_34545 [Caldilineaceae bacterium]
MKPLTRALLPMLMISLFASVLVGCIHPEPPTAVPLPEIAGQYNTVVGLTDNNSCGDVTVQSLPTTIQQEAGATEFVFSHAGNDYSATLEADGSFTTEHKRLVAGSTIFTVTFTGTFSTTGFTGTGTVEMQQSEAPTYCSYVVSMEGSK